LIVSLSFFKQFPFILLFLFIFYKYIPLNAPFFGGKIFLILMGMIGIYYIKQHKRSLRVNNEMCLMLIFVGYQGLSLFWSINPIKGGVLFIVWTTIFVIFHTPFNVRKEVLYKFYISYYWVAAVIATVGLILYFLHLLPIGSGANAFRGLGRQVAVYYIVLASPIYFFIKEVKVTSKLKKMILHSSFILIILSILLHFSRLGYAVTLLFIGCFFWGLGYRKRMGSVFLKLGALLSCLLIFPPIFNRIKSLGIIFNLYRGLLGNKSIITYRNLRRFQLIQAGIDLFKDHFWVGTGLGGYLDIFIESYDKWGYKKTPHNGLIRMSGELGIIGISLFYIVWLYILRRVYKILKKIKKAEDKYILAYLFGLILTYVLAMFLGELYNNLFIIFMMVPAYQRFKQIENEMNHKTLKVENEKKDIAI